MAKLVKVFIAAASFFVIVPAAAQQQPAQLPETGERAGPVQR